MRRGVFFATLLTGCALVAPAAAPAAEVIGQTAPGVVTACTMDRSYTQRFLAGGAAYTASTSGVITSWSARANATPNHTLKLLVLRPDPGSGPPNFPLTTVAKDEVRTLTAPNVVNTFAVRLPIEAGDQLGLYVPLGQPAADPFGRCVFPQTADDEVGHLLGEPAVGASANFSSAFLDVRLNASAVVEPDADGDGFGDESQDQCPGQAGDDGGCDRIAPETTIAAGPKAKTKKKTATFDFTGDDARALAGFQCSLDGGAFASCTSPHTVKVKKGKHTFSVRTVDQAGNVDGSPANFAWKVKKKKKKK